MPVALTAEGPVLEQEDQVVVEELIFELHRLTIYPSCL
jgi:hypothetical protein